MSSAETAARFCYGYEKATAKCRKAEHWKGPKNQQLVEWDLLDRYDMLTYRKSNAVAPRADAQVLENMKRDALFMKHYEKSRTADN